MDALALVPVGAGGRGCAGTGVRRACRWCPTRGLVGFVTATSTPRPPREVHAAARTRQSADRRHRAAQPRARGIVRGTRRLDTGLEFEYPGAARRRRRRGRRGDHLGHGRGLSQGPARGRRWSSVSERRATGLLQTAALEPCGRLRPPRAGVRDARARTDHGAAATAIQRTTDAAGRRTAEPVRPSAREVARSRSWCLGLGFADPGEPPRPTRRPELRFCPDLAFCWWWRSALVSGHGPRHTWPRGGRARLRHRPARGLAPGPARAAARARRSRRRGFAGPASSTCARPRPRPLFVLGSLRARQRACGDLGRCSGFFASGELAARRGIVPCRSLSCQVLINAASSPFAGARLIESRSPIAGDEDRARELRSSAVERPARDRASRSSSDRSAADGRATWSGASPPRIPLVMACSSCWCVLRTCSSAPVPAAGDRGRRHAGALAQRNSVRTRPPRGAARR